MSVTKADWIAGLRSGKFEQGQNMLKSQQGEYCCLGVAIALTGEYEELFIEPEEDEIETLTDVVRFVPKNAPDGALATHFTTDIGEFTVSDFPMNMAFRSVLQQLNDLHNWTFNDIADWLETQESGLVNKKASVILDEAEDWMSARDKNG